MKSLAVPGARLYEEVHGSGPLLLMVPGANGTANIFTGVTEHLAAHYTVVTYDRRGFSRSYLDRPQDYDHRLETEVRVPTTSEMVPVAASLPAPTC